jgi:negative regulator of sigma E activity
MWIVAIERRHLPDRRQRERRTAGATVDVTRIEHENLYGQVAEVLRMLRGIETELQRQRERIAMVERDLQTLTLSHAKGA